VGPKASLGHLEKRKMSCSCLDSNPGSPDPLRGHYTEFLNIINRETYAKSNENEMYVSFLCTHFVGTIFHSDE
jgi:hypothetical protein